MLHMKLHDDGRSQIILTLDRNKRSAFRLTETASTGKKRIDIRPIDSLLLLYHDDNADSVEFMARNYGADRRTKTIAFEYDCAYVTYVWLRAMKRKREEGMMDSIQLSIRNFRSFQAQMSRIVQMNIKIDIVQSEWIRFLVYKALIQSCATTSIPFKFILR